MPKMSLVRMRYALAKLHGLHLHLVVMILLAAETGSQNSAGAATCEKLSPCSCRDGDTIFDLSPLGFKNNTPRFKDQMGQYPQSFSWNPCYPFDENRCAGVAGCQVVAWPRNYFSLGTQDSAEFVTAPDGHRLQIKYQADQPDPRTGVKRTLYVTLVCTEDKEPRLKVDGERPETLGEYDLTLYSKHACPRAAPRNQLAISIGTIMVISLTGLLLVYLSVGVVFQVFVRKSKGLEVLPNLTFWSALPGLVKDGCLFVVRRGKTNEMYQALS